ncbi:MAG TPA: hypothetical protein VMN77_02855 [Nitrospiria bacterium]|jgi:hypothetical protein|nr:hypothetical protein [Nitrospiria bacterium]
MAKTVPKQEFVDLGDRRVLADELKRSVEICLKDGRYVAVLCVIVCGIDAFASGHKSFTAHKRDYLKILEKHFPVLAKQLGAQKFYNTYRHGMVHHFHPMKGYIMSQDQDLDGQYVAELKIEGRPEPAISINMDRLIRDFIHLCDYVISGNPLP